MLSLRLVTAPPERLNAGWRTIRGFIVLTWNTFRQKVSRKRAKARLRRMDAGDVPGVLHNGWKYLFSLGGVLPVAQPGRSVHG
jgi:hypothetical protein